MDHQNENTTVQEYVEIIRDLERDNKVARVKDIAEKRGVTRSSVSLVLNLLVEKDLIAHEQYGHVCLTERGHQLANDLELKHNTIKKFLIILGVPEEIAEQDACRLEHYVSALTSNALFDFIKHVESERPNILAQKIIDFVQKR